jgi:1-acyl-sn-glycerol-3-phosphate acyltransferase
MANNPIQALLHAIAKAWFMITFVFGLAFAATATRLAHLLIFLNQTQREKLSARLAGIGFRIIFALNPHISIENAADTEPAWDEIFSEEGSSPFVIVNHTSQLDSIVFSACLPGFVIHRMKTLAKSGLFKLPIFGTILRLCGHFPVYFKSEAKAGDFSVDKDAQEKVTQAIDEHVKEGGGLSFFPEGQINRIDSKVLQPFRRGAFESFAKKHAMRMYAFLHTGVDRVWPINDSFGGLPGTIRFKFFRVPHPPANMELAEFVDHIQKMMQLELDIMHAIDEHVDPAEIARRRAMLSNEVKATAKGDVKLEQQLTDAVNMEPKNEKKKE